MATDKPPTSAPSVVCCGASVLWRRLWQRRWYCGKHHHLFTYPYIYLLIHRPILYSRERWKRTQVFWKLLLCSGERYTKNITAEIIWYVNPGASTQKKQLVEHLTSFCTSGSPFESFCASIDVSLFFFFADFTLLSRDYWPAFSFLPFFPFCLSSVRSGVGLQSHVSPWWKGQIVTNNGWRDIKERKWQGRSYNSIPTNFHED